MNFKAYKSNKNECFCHFHKKMLISKILMHQSLKISILNQLYQDVHVFVKMHEHQK